MLLRPLPMVFFACAVLAGQLGAAQKESSKPAAPEVVTVDRIDTLLKAGWKLPPPLYPKSARYNRNEGSIYMEVSTDAKGHVSKATILKVDKSANVASLRSMVLLWAWYHWSGPPNSKAVVHFQFRMR